MITKFSPPHNKEDIEKKGEFKVDVNQDKSKGAGPTQTNITRLPATKVQEQEPSFF